MAQTRGPSSWTFRARVPGDGPLLGFVGTPLCRAFDPTTLSRHGGPCFSIILRGPSPAWSHPSGGRVRRKADKTQYRLER